MSATALHRLPPFAAGLTLGDVVFRIRGGLRLASRTRDLLLVLAGTLILIAGAYISFTVPQIAIAGVYVPVNDYVPLTLQTFGVLFTGAALGVRRGVASTLIYLAIGALGFPVFAAGSDGIHASGMDTIATIDSGRIVLGVTGGYLIGFLLAGAVVGRAAELGWDRRLRSSVVAMLVGTIVIYAVGLPWLAIAANLSVDDALRYGLFPFVPGDLLKLALAAGCLPVAWRLLARLDGGRS